MLAEVWTEGDRAWLGKAAKSWASAPEVSRPEGALLHNWFCLDTFFKLRHNWHNTCTDFYKNETCSLILRKSRNYTWSSDRSRSKEQTWGLFFLVSQLCSPLSSFSTASSLMVAKWPPLDTSCSFTALRPPLQTKVLGLTPRAKLGHKPNPEPINVQGDEVHWLAQAWVNSWSWWWGYPNQTPWAQNGTGGHPQGKLKYTY